MRLWLYNSSVGELAYHYHPPVVVSTTAPFLGPALGGTRVAVYGSHLPHAETANRHCRFRPTSAKHQIGQVVPAQYVSRHRIDCIAPPAPLNAHVTNLTDEHVYIEVTSNGGANFSHSRVAYTYFLPPAVTRLVPPRLYASGGTTLQVLGAGFSHRASTHSLLRVCLRTTRGMELTVPATYVSDGRIDCVAPLIGLSGEVVVEMSNNAVDFTTSGVRLTVIDMLLTSLTPSSGPTLGRTRVTVTGTGLVPAEHPTACHFGGATSPATVDASTSLSCLSPRFTHHGAVLLRVSQHNVTQSFGLRFVYTSVQAIDSIWPLAGPPRGGTVLTLIGSGFSQSIGYCHFAHAATPPSISVAAPLHTLASANDVTDQTNPGAVVPAVWRSPQRVECTTPRRLQGETEKAGMVGESAVEISINGEQVRGLPYPGLRPSLLRPRHGRIRS